MEMSNLRKDVGILEHIRDYCEDISETHKEYGNSKQVFLANKSYERRLAFDILQVGELTGKLSEEFREETKNRIPWRAIKDMRNHIVHGYGTIDFDILWSSSHEDIYELHEFCQQTVRLYDSKMMESFSENFFINELTDDWERD